MPVPKIAEVSFTSADRVRDVIHNFGRRRIRLAVPEVRRRPAEKVHPAGTPGDQEDRQVRPRRARSAVLDLESDQTRRVPGRRGGVDDISHEGLRVLLREEGVSFQKVKTWKRSRDPDYAVKKARVEHLYAIADGDVVSDPDEPQAIFCLDEFGPLNLQPHPGRQWAERGGRHKDPDREPRRRRRATYTRPHGVRHLFAAYDLGKDKLYGHVKTTKNRSTFLEFCRYLRALYPAEVRIAIVCDNFSPHLTTRKCQRVGLWAEANNVEIAYTPTNSSWLNRIEAQFTALRYFALDGTDHGSHREQASMIRRYIIWRNKHAEDQQLREIVDRANVA
ncbi:transposase [Rhodococcus pyridinivorans]|uniref:transposase n=1 Tax=Rhodococcus pyridinivorans TaxID=103816 RepID=UPI002016276C|nr:transposase [Rhodococcus pyridinivorans]